MTGSDPLHGNAKPQLFLVAPWLAKADRTGQNLPVSGTMSRFPAIFLILILSLSSSAQVKPGDKENKADPSWPSHYSKGRKTFDGTGKYYMGREISYVMGHQAIRWLERSNREEEEAPSKAIAALNLKPTDVIADIGAGSGYYTFRLAPLVPKGKVVAVDIQPEMIDFLERKEKQLGLTNVEAHLGEVDDTKLKPGSINAALMVDAYHEFSHPREMMESLFKALKPGGRIILLEYRAEDPTVPIKPLHKMSVAQSRKEMEAVGLKWKSTDSKLLPWQHFMIFEKPAGAKGKKRESLEK